jgi:hypothetical protein
MNGFYKANGGCGYVKKPDFLMQTCPDGKVFDPTADLPVKTTLKVHNHSFPFLSEMQNRVLLDHLFLRSKCTWAMVGSRTLSRHISIHIPLQISM